MALKDNFGIYASITPWAGDAVVGLYPDCCASGSFRNREVNDAFMDLAFCRIPFGDQNSIGANSGVAQKAQRLSDHSFGSGQPIWQRRVQAVVQRQPPESEHELKGKIAAITQWLNRGKSTEL